MKPRRLDLGITQFLRRHFRRNPAHQLAHRPPAQGTFLQGLPTHRAVELKSFCTDKATSIRVIRILRSVFVNRHGPKPEKGAGRQTAPSFRSKRETNLPGGLCHSRNHPVRCHLTEGNPGETEATQKRTTAPGHFTTIHETGRTCITRKHRQTNIIFLLLQLVTKVCVFRNGFSFALVALNPAFSCHGRGDIRGIATVARVF